MAIYSGSVIDMSKTLDVTSARITRAVKAELGRRGLTGVALAPVLGLNRNAVYARLRFERPFDTSELSKIAEFFGMTVDDLLDSAELDRFITDQSEVANPAA